MSPPKIFDRSQYAARRARAERLGEENYLVEDVALALQERIVTASRRFGRALDLGSRQQSFVRLAPLAEEWIRTSIFVPPENSMARVVVTDEECLALGEQRFDLAVSVLGLHAVNDLPGALLQIRRTLNPEGLFVAALFGGSTLHELRHAFAAGEAETLGGISPRVAPFADVRDLGALLQRAGFAMPVSDVERTTVRYADFFRLIADLRAMGETNALSERSPKPLRRATLSRVISCYAERDGEPDGRLRATFDVVYLTGWSG